MAFKMNDHGRESEKVGEEMQYKPLFQNSMKTSDTTHSSDPKSPIKVANEKSRINGNSMEKVHNNYIGLYDRLKIQQV